MTPKPTVALVDMFGNNLSQDIPESQAHYISAFKVGCDSIHLQLWCDALKCGQVCDLCPGGKAAPVEYTGKNNEAKKSCCAIIGTKPSNNIFNCSHGLMESAKETERTNTFTAQLLRSIDGLPPANITRLERLYSSSSLTSLIGESVMRQDKLTQSSDDVSGPG